jgi:hypothetical protein
MRGVGRLGHGSDGARPLDPRRLTVPIRFREEYAIRVRLYFQPAEGGSLQRGQGNLGGAKGD